MAIYLGRRRQGDLIRFCSSSLPTRESHGHLYTAVIGPFKSKVGASYFARFGRNNPHIQTADDAERLAHYLSDSDEYVVIVSPELDPQEFCKPGYEVVHTLEFWKAGDFPADVILRPERDGLGAQIEPDLSPILDQFQSKTRAHEDGWLEAPYEDRISGLNE